jgi:hypothetical protein
VALKSWGCKFKSLLQKLLYRFIGKFPQGREKNYKSEILSPWDLFPHTLQTIAQKSALHFFNSVWSRAVDIATLLHSPMRVGRFRKTERWGRIVIRSNLAGRTLAIGPNGKRTRHQGTPDLSACWVQWTMSSGKTNVIISDDTIDTSFWLKYDNIGFIIIPAGTVTLSPDIYFIPKIVTRSRTDSSSTLSFFSLFQVLLVSMFVTYTQFGKWAVEPEISQMSAE